MNLTNLFETQRILDARIELEHPPIEGEDRLTKKILALLVELGECANEYRSFKFWSNDQKPRYKKEHTNGINGETWVTYPLLEEYVDCLHFILSIGLERKETTMTVPYDDSWVIKEESITQQFNSMFGVIGSFSENKAVGNYCSILDLFIGLGELLGFTWDQIETAYYSKNAINHTRQDTGY